MKLSEHILKQIEVFTRPYKFEEGQEINRYEDIKRIFLYRRDKFMSCQDNKAIFWQLAAQRHPHFKKNILPSIKDFYPEGRGEYNYFQAWLTKVMYRRWARETGLVHDVESLCSYLTDFGEAVWKKTPKGGEKDLAVCDLRRIFFDRTVLFEYSDKIEVHELTKAQLYEKDDVWKGIKEITKEKETDKYKIYEFEGWFAEEGKPKKIHSFVYGQGDKQKILFEEPVKDDKSLYQYFKLNDELIGIYQRLFVLQELANRRVNQNDEAQQIASLLILKSANPTVSGNVLQDAINGQIVNDPTLDQVRIDNRAISAFAQEILMIEAQADKLCMTPEVITGSDLPSGTPFRSMAVLTNKAVSAFKSIRTKIAEQISETLVNDIFPDITKKWENQIVEISDDEGDIREYNNSVGRYLLNKWMTEEKDKNGFFPTTREMEAKKQQIAESFDREGRKIKIEKDFFNWKFGMIYNHSNEIEDRAQMNDTMNNLLQYKMANPAIANDPLFRQLAEKNGVSAFKMTTEELQGLQPQAVPQVKPEKDKLMNAVDPNL